MGKKRKYTPPTFETMHPEGRHVYMAIYDTLYTSPAWKELTDKQVRLYLFCRWQYWAKRENRPGADYPDYEPYQATEVFYLNWAKVQLFISQYRLIPDLFQVYLAVPLVC